ncbi:IS3 family transposase [Lujinxingia sediminis]|nr:IS3 family transposase [Lujinxingia sediminis]
MDLWGALQNVNSLHNWLKKHREERGGDVSESEQEELQRLRQKYRILKKKTPHSKKGRSLLCEGAEVRCHFIQAERANHSVSMLCRVMRVPRSTFYAWRSRKPSARAQQIARLKPLIRRIFLKSCKRYGSPRIHRELRHHDVSIGRKRVARLMHKQGLRSVSRRKYRCTTGSNHDYKFAPNTLNRSFNISEPNRAWVGDITYVWTIRGWLYLAVLIDLASRRVVGWAMATHMRQEFIQACLQMAVHRRRPESGWLHHTDQGSQYAADDYRKMVENWGGQISMSNKGDCWDNAVAESFFASLKKEFVYQTTFTTQDEASLAVLDYIRWYNARKLHSAIGFESPNRYEEKMARAALGQAA